MGSKTNHLCSNCFVPNLPDRTGFFNLGFPRKTTSQCSLRGFGTSLHLSPAYHRCALCSQQKHKRIRSWEKWFDCVQRTPNRGETKSKPAPKPKRNNHSKPSKQLLRLLDGFRKQFCDKFIDKACYLSGLWRTWHGQRRLVVNVKIQAFPSGLYDSCKWFVTLSKARNCAGLSPGREFQSWRGGAIESNYRAARKSTDQRGANSSGARDSTSGKRVKQWNMDWS